jgi:peptidoglycan-associated lipoprotein
MRRLSIICLLGTALVVPSTAAAQGSEETRPALLTVNGDTGIWFVPTAEILPAKRWSVSFQRTNIDDGQGFTDVSMFPVTFGVGIGNFMEFFGSWSLVTRIDRDTRPLFFSSSPEENNTGTGGGIVVNHPLVRSEWIGNEIGDLWLGGKFSLLGKEARDMGLGVRAMIKLPIGDESSGASSGKMDTVLDFVVSGRKDIAEIAGYGGLIFRGSPDGYELTNGFRWGIGAAFPQRYSAGFRFSAELYGESYFDDVVTAPPGLTGSDGSPVPTESFVKGPVVGVLGLTWQAPKGFFVGAAVNWNFSMNSRDEASPLLPFGFESTPKDDKSLEFRIGFHPGARRPQAVIAKPTAPPVVTPPPVAPPPVAPPPVAPPPPANRPPTVRAMCDPCTIPVGATSTVTADASDPDGDTLTYAWKSATGKLANAAIRQTTWTAPMTPGTYPVTVVVSDGRGNTATDTVNITVVAPAVKEFTFEDVHFDFDRNELRKDSLAILDSLAAAMLSNPKLRVEIEGHACNIGTAEYNLALGERRALAVRTYLLSAGVAADRMRIISYGEERPAFDNSSEDTRRLNRRAALVVRLQQDQ